MPTWNSNGTSSTNPFRSYLRVPSYRWLPPGWRRNIILQWAMLPSCCCSTRGFWSVYQHSFITCTSVHQPLKFWQKKLISNQLKVSNYNQKSFQLLSVCDSMLQWSINQVNPINFSCFLLPAQLTFLSVGQKFFVLEFMLAFSGSGTGRSMQSTFST